MFTQYFEGCNSTEQIKSRYKSLVKQYHPDLNPKNVQECTRILAEINNEYEKVIKLTYREESGENFSQKAEDALIHLASILEGIIHLPDIEIEICGYWVWVGGNTRPLADTFKALGFRFSGPKVKWYFAPDLGPKKKRGFYNMEQIRNKYGSEKVQTSPNAQLG